MKSYKYDFIYNLHKMGKLTTYKFRIDKQEKDEAFAVLRNIGIKPSQALRLFFQQIRKTHAMPFPIEDLPNDKVGS